MGYRYHLAIVDKEKARAMAIQKEDVFLPSITDKDSDNIAFQSVIFKEKTKKKVKKNFIPGKNYEKP